MPISAYAQITQVLRLGPANGGLAGKNPEVLVRQRTLTQIHA